MAPVHARETRATGVVAGTGTASPANDEDASDFAVAAEQPKVDAYLQSLEKGLMVLDAFTAEQPMLSIADIARRTGLDRATSRRAALTLEHLGYLRLEGKRFSLTAKVLGFGFHYLAALPFWSLAQPVLEDLSDQLNETVSIGVLEAQDVVFTLRVPAKRFLRFESSIGSRVPAHLHSIGHVLLAAKPAASLDAFMAKIDFTPLTSHSVTEPRALRADIALTRDRGWSLTAMQYEETYGGISVPLINARGQAIAALNASFIVDSGAQKRAIDDILPRLKLAARRLHESTGKR